MKRITFKATNFNKRKITVQHAIQILSRNKIDVNEEEATVILDFLYHIAKTNKKPENPEIPE